MCLQKRFYIRSSFRKRIGSLHHKRFSKHPLFSTFSLFLTMNMVRNISNTDFIINQLKNVFTQEKLQAPFISQKEICTLHCRSVLKHPLFTTFLLVFTVDEVCNISNK